MNPDDVRFRLLRRDDVPATNPLRLSYRFGLQDTKQQIIAGKRQRDGSLVFDFSLQVKKGKDPRRPVFTGRFASGPVDDRFVYLSWLAIERGDYINRVKARLATIDCKMVRASQDQGRSITADMTGWIPGDPRKHVTWFLSLRLWAQPSRVSPQCGNVERVQTQTLAGEAQRRAANAAASQAP